MLSAHDILSALESADEFAVESLYQQKRETTNPVAHHFGWK